MCLLVWPIHNSASQTNNMRFIKYQQHLTQKNNNSNNSKQEEKNTNCNYVMFELKLMHLDFMQHICNIICNRLDNGYINTHNTSVYDRDRDRDRIDNLNSIFTLFQHLAEL